MLGPALRARVDGMILQEACLAAHRDFDRFEYTDAAAFLRWLCRLIENRIRDGLDDFAAAKRQPVELPRPDPDGSARAFDVAQNREILTLAHIDAPARAVADSAGFRRLIVGFADGRIAWWPGPDVKRPVSAKKTPSNECPGPRSAFAQYANR